MSDPRNVAHDKKVIQEKKHHGQDPAADAVAKVQPGKKPEQKHPHAEDPATVREEAKAQEIAEIQKTVHQHQEKTDPHLKA